MPPKFPDKEAERAYVKERLTAALRIFGKMNFDHHVAGHLSVRDPVDPNTYWVNPLGKAFKCMRVSDLVRVDKEGNVIGGGQPGWRIANKAGFVIHSSIHQSRPDAVAICHAHTPYGKAFAALGKNLEMISQDSCAFYNDVALYSDFGGMVVKEDEGKRIAEALGKCKAGILQSHGLITVASSIEAAVLWFIMLEHECQVQLLADSAAAGRGTQTVKISPEEAAFTYQGTGLPESGYFMAKPYFEVIEAEFGHEYKQ
ncbi:class II aldolase/adducin domain-containing protein [Clavulina sp. PMI_390]|nr:class II aldolase/adducin domain-containing protein [Clavulina sp. PMI_390]